MEQSIEEIIRGIVKEELATALKNKITLQIQYDDGQEEKADETSVSDVDSNENNTNQVDQQ
jgi:hypothetical protein